jgi:hypothetical protein
MMAKWFLSGRYGKMLLAPHLRKMNNNALGNMNIKFP